MTTRVPSGRGRGALSLLCSLLVSLAWLPAASAQPAKGGPAKGKDAPAKDAPAKDAPVKDTPVAPPAADAGPTLPQAPRNPSKEDLKKAKAVFEAGGRAFEQGDFPAAIQAFDQAYALSGRASVLFSLAQAHRKRFVDTGAAIHRDTALVLYRSYLDQVKTGGRRADAIKGVESLGGAATTGGPTASAPVFTPLVKKTQLAIDSATPGAMISVDGGPPAPPQVMAEVTTGRHTIKVTAPGYVDKEFSTQAVEGQITPETYELEEQPAKLQIAMPSGSTLYLDGRDMGESSVLTLASGSHFISVAKMGHHSEARPLEVGPGAKDKLSFDLRTTTQRDAAIGFLIGGAGTMVAGGVVLGMAFLRQAEAQEIDNVRKGSTITTQQLAEYQELSKQRDELRATGVVIGGAGGIAFLIGGALFFLDNQPPKPPPVEGGGGGGKKKGDEKPEGPSEMEELSFAPWLSPLPGDGLGGGGTWTLKF